MNAAQLDNLLTGASLVLVRGAQGSGKSTFARWLAENRGYLLLEPDDFYHAGPLYFWERSWQRIAHRWNRWRTAKALCAGQKVVVAETFYLRKHLFPYLAITPHYEVFRMTGTFENVHGVPAPVVQDVRDQMEPLSGETVLPPTWRENL